MRILLTCEEYFPDVGGAEVCVANLKHQFERRGHQVRLLTNTTKTLSSDTDAIVRMKWKFSPLSLARTVRMLWKLIGESDVVHCQYSYRLAALSAVVCRLRGVPLIVTQQGKGIVPEAHPRWRYRFLFLLCQHISMRGATLLTSTSKEITELTARFVDRSKIVSVTNGYDAELFHPDSSLPVPPEFTRVMPTNIFLTVRRLVPKNGIHILIQALAVVRRTHPDFHYMAIGDGRSRSSIEQVIARCDMGEHVSLLGMRSNDEIRPFLQHADLVFVPSSAEATSISCIEAMGMEKPLIASRVGGLIDLLGSDSTYGTLVPIYGQETCTYDPPETLSEEQLMPLVDAVRHFLNDKRPFEERARKGRTYVAAHCSWHAIAETYLSLYRLVLPPSRS